MPAPNEPTAQAAAAAQPDAKRRWLRTDTILLASALGVLLWLTSDVLFIVFAGILLAVTLDALSTPISRRTPLGRGWALTAVVIVLMLLLAAGAMAVIPQFMQQFSQIWEQLSDLTAQARQALQQYPWVQQILGMGEQAGQDPQHQQGQQMLGTAGEIAGRVASTTMRFLGGLTTVILIVVLALFMAANPGLYRGGLVRLLPHRHRSRADETLSTMGYALRWWLLGQLVSMLVLGVSTALGLLVLGVELWLGLGMLVALLTFIPFLGPIIAGIPVVVLSFAGGAQTGLMVLAFYLVLQNVEGNIITPMIQQRAIDLPPALLISMQLLFGSLFGIAGLILAAPLAVIGMVAVKLLYIEDVLGDQRATP